MVGLWQGLVMVRRRQWWRWRWHGLHRAEDRLFQLVSSRLLPLRASFFCRTAVPNSKKDCGKA